MDDDVAMVVHFIGRRLRARGACMRTAEGFMR